MKRELLRMTRPVGVLMVVALTAFYPLAVQAQTVTVYRWDPGDPLGPIQGEYFPDESSALAALNDAYGVDVGSCSPD